MGRIDCVGFEIFTFQLVEKIRYRFQNDVFQVVKTFILIQDVSPLIFNLLHQSRINILYGMIENEVEESWRKFLIFSHLTVLVLKDVPRLVKVVLEVVVDLLVVLHWGLAMFVLNFAKFQEVDTFPADVIDQLDHTPDASNASRAVHHVVKVILIDLSSDDAEQGVEVSLSLCKKLGPSSYSFSTSFISCWSFSGCQCMDSVDIFIDRFPVLVNSSWEEMEEVFILFYIN